jgi:hypothetical protein
VEFGLKNNLKFMKLLGEIGKIFEEYKNYWNFLDADFFNY